MRVNPLLTFKNPKTANISPASDNQRLAIWRIAETQRSTRDYRLHTSVDHLGEGSFTPVKSRALATFSRGRSLLRDVLRGLRYIVRIVKCGLGWSHRKELMLSSSNTRKVGTTLEFRPPSYCTIASRSCSLFRYRIFGLLEG